MPEANGYADRIGACYGWSQIMAKTIVIYGSVASGRGIAASHIKSNIDELQIVTGDTIFEGSLNILLRRPLLLSDANAATFDKNTRLLWRASVNGMPAWIYRWRHAPLHVIEILSTTHLRSTLNLKDGARVVIDIRKQDVLDVPTVGKLVWALVWLGRQHWSYTRDEYYFWTKEWCLEYGATQRGTKQDMQQLFVRLSKGVIKKIPGAVNIANRLRQYPASVDERRNLYVFDRIELGISSNEADRPPRQIQNILNYTKTSGSSYSARKFPAGYHSLEINGQFLRGQRDPKQRFQLVPIDFQNKTVLDVGCNQGGMLFQLDNRIKWGVGIDYDYRMINAANKIKSVRQSNTLNFYMFNLEEEPLNLIEDFIPSEKVDVVLLLSVCMWLDNWREVVAYCLKISHSMVFETNGTDDQQDTQEQLLRTLYEDVTLLAETSEDDPSQKRRKLFCCCLPKAQFLAPRDSIETKSGSGSENNDGTNLSA